MSSGEGEPVPPDFSVFLDCLARPQERLLPVSRKLGCDVEELQSASYDCLRRLLFSDESDHYRILGLAPDAGAGEIRHRYRLLIGLFHPDRIAASEPWEEQFVRRLNQAYGVLKRPERRRQYDRERRKPDAAGRQSPAGQGTSAKTAPKRSRPMVTPEVSASEWLYRSRFLQRHPKVIIWLLILVVLGGLLLWATKGSKVTTLTLAEVPPAQARVADKVPHSLFSSGDERPARRSPRTPPIVSPFPPEDIVSPGKPLAEDQVTEPDGQSPVGSTGSELAPVSPRAEQEKPMSRPQHAGRSVPDKPTVLSTGSNGKIRKSVDEEVVEGAPIEGHLNGFDDTPVPASLIVHTEPGSGAMPTDADAPQLQPEYVLMQYVRAFEAGDLERLLSLFTLEPRSNAGIGRVRLRESYSRVFARTSNRTFTVEQVTIRPLNSSTFEMVSRMHLTTWERNGGQGRYQGDMAFQLVRKGRKLYIASLLHNIIHQPAEKPSR